MVSRENHQGRMEGKGLTGKPLISRLDIHGKGKSGHCSLRGVVPPAHSQLVGWASIRASEEDRRSGSGGTVISEAAPARPHAQHLTSSLLQSLPRSPEVEDFYSSFIGEETGSERLSESPKVTQLEHGRVGWNSGVWLFQAHLATSCQSVGRFSAALAGWLLPASTPSLV